MAKEKSAGKNGIIIEMLWYGGKQVLQMLAILYKIRYSQRLRKYPYGLHLLKGG